jgi:hypothetical protein
MSRPGERPAELVDLRGAWRRDGRCLSEGPMEEVADVLWLQVGRFFCDLRTLGPRAGSPHVLDQPQAFSGTVVISSGQIAFHHDLDSLARDPLHPDEGTVHRRDDVMVERGPGFEETWVATSLPGDDAEIAELRPSGVIDGAPVARLIRIGRVALAVWGGASPGGAQFTKDKDNEWMGDRTLHEPDATMAIDAAARSLGQGGPLPDNWVTIDPGEV